MVKIKKPEIGSHREIRGIDFICKGFDADGKPQWRKADKIEKAHQDGERHPKNPKLIWVSSAAGGKGDWRTDPNLRGKKANAGGGGGGAAAPASGGGASASGQESGGGEDNGGNQQNQTQPAQPKQKFKYTPKEPKIEYTEKKPEDGIEFDIPESWTVKNPKTGKTTTITAQGQADAYAKLTDDALLKFLNNPGKPGSKNSMYCRQIAYDEARARGIEEDKIEVKGTLKEYWDKLKAIKQQTEDDDNKDVDEEDFEDYDTEALHGFDVDAFAEQFPNGDKGWMNEDDKRVKAAFNNLTSLVDRQKYDAVLDMLKRREPNYKSPSRVVKGLNKSYLGFLVSKSSPLMVSAGGAGVGKTWGFKKMAAALSLVQYDPEKHKEEDKKDQYDWVLCPNPKSEKEFYALLKQHNGKILLFDDNDKILTGASYRATMKTLSDTDPNSRYFKNPEGEMEKFTGKICILSNKSSNNLINMAGADGAEDVKAVLSRAKKYDIQFTVKENLDVLADRYKNMEIDGLTIDKSEEPKLRQAVFDFIVENQSKLDPATFTVRKFGEIMKAVEDDYIVSSLSKQSSDVADYAYDEDDAEGWKSVAMDILNKADDGSDFADTKDGNGDDKKAVAAAMKKIKKNNPKLYKELLSDDDEDVDDKELTGTADSDDETETEEAEKALQSDMSLEDAEDLLLG